MCNEQKCFSWLKTARDHVSEHHNILFEELKINSGKYIKENVDQSNSQISNVEIIDQRNTTISNDINEETEQEIIEESPKKNANEKTEKCSYCKKYFKKRSIKGHIRIHLKNTVYRCSLCSSTFPTPHLREV